MSRLMMPLRALTAEDVMSRNVQSIPETMPMRAAALALHRADHRGTPVVDDRGRCVGILSATDFMEWSRGAADPETGIGRGICPYRVPAHPASGFGGWTCVRGFGSCPFQRQHPTAGGQQLSICTWPDPDPGLAARLARLAPDAVGRHMCREVVTVSRHTPLSELARVMVEKHIHRLIVTDADGRPVGIVSSTDILAAVAAEPAETYP